MNQGIKGWVISLWIDTSQINSNSRNDLPYLSWSPYDRVTIKVADNFSDFFDTEEHFNEESFKWNGTVQKLHLVPMEETGEFNWIPNSNPDSKCLIETPDSGSSCYGLYCIVTARFKNLFENIDDVEQRLCNKLKEHFSNTNVAWQAFRSLGAEDFVGIFLADSISELEKACDFFKQVTYTTNSGKSEPLFSSVYSFLGLNNPIYCGNPNATLIERLYLKVGVTKQRVCDILNDYFKTKFPNNYANISYRKSISNKGYLEIEIPNDENVLSCFHNQKDIGIFNGNSDFYNKYIDSSRTYWYTELESSYDADIGNVKPLKLCDIKKIDYTNPEFNPISQFILKEYERLQDSQRCLWWRSILTEQYKVYYEFVENYTNERNETDLCSLNNKIQTVLLHINQATTPIYEVPYHNYYYSGSYNDVLRMYYGIIATIFNLACKLFRNEKSYQYDITYCVDFEATTKVHSTMYTINNNNLRFVVFHLPYDAFREFGKTTKLLLHEVFHYVAPYNRSIRNNIFVKVLIIQVFEVYIAYLKDKGLTKDNSKNITSYFYEQFEIFCKSVDDLIGNSLDNKILNDFTSTSKLNKLMKLPEQICNIICAIIQKYCGLWLHEVENYCSYTDMYPELFNNQKRIPSYFMESIRQTALANKEAFCDLNMIYILNMSLEEYIPLLYNAFLGKYSDESVNKPLSALLDSKNISIGSFELRLGMVLDQYYLEDKRLDTSKVECNYINIFKNDINQILQDNSNETFRQFCEYLIMVYDRYLLAFHIKRKLFGDFFTNERQWFTSFKENHYSEQNKLQKAAKAQNKIEDNISVIRDFINVEIDKKSLNCNKNTVTITNSYPITDASDLLKKEHIVVHDIGEYVHSCCQIIQEWGIDTVWFRGVCSKDYLLTPSLFRYKHLNTELSLYENQAKLLKDAYYITLSEPSIWTEQMKNTLDHMCLLQHYGLPTSLLDFSDDMLMALHFSLNPDSESDIEKINNYTHQPKVVLFNPFNYRDAILSLKEETPIKKSKHDNPFLMNFEYNQPLEYYVHDMSSEYLTKHSQDNTKPYEPNRCTDLYPKPLAISRTNDRVIAQKGTFVAFNLSARPDKNESDIKKRYDYLSLERIQDDYFKLLVGKHKPIYNEEFLKEIYIDKISIPTIKRQLKSMNITTARAYPELFRLFKEYIDRM